MKTVIAQLKHPHFSVGDISCCHRMGRISTSEESQLILFKLPELDVKHKVFSKKSLKGTGIILSEFLTVCRQVFMVVRQKFGLSICWTHEGSIYILGSNSVRYRISSIAKLDKLDVSLQTKPAAPTKEPAGVPKSRWTGTSNRK